MGGLGFNTAGFTPLSISEQLFITVEYDYTMKIQNGIKEDIDKKILTMLGVKKQNIQQINFDISVSNVESLNKILMNLGKSTKSNFIKETNIGIKSIQLSPLYYEVGIFNVKKDFKILTNFGVFKDNNYRYNTNLGMVANIRDFRYRVYFRVKGNLLYKGSDYSTGSRGN